MEVQLLHEVGSVFLHGLYTDIEVIRNLSVLIPLGNKLQDFSLALGEGIPWGGVLQDISVSTSPKGSENVFLGSVNRQG